MKYLPALIIAMGCSVAATAQHKVGATAIPALQEKKKQANSKTTVKIKADTPLFGFDGRSFPAGSIIRDTKKK